MKQISLVKVTDTALIQIFFTFCYGYGVSRYMCTVQSINPFLLTVTVQRFFLHVRGLWPISGTQLWARWEPESLETALTQQFSQVLND